MTDREQIRRDYSTQPQVQELLAELEQAERERDEARDDRDEARRIADVWRQKRDYTLETKLAAEARLVKADALAEALRRIAHHPFNVMSTDAKDVHAMKDIAGEALAVYEQGQKPCHTEGSK